MHKFKAKSTMNVANMWSKILKSFVIGKSAIFKDSLPKNQHENAMT